jgi:membrane protein implicated in regulation of membrane protease activity
MRMSIVTGKVVAGCFALSAFAVAVLAGLAGGNPTAQILLRALVAMFVCYPVGLAVGTVFERVIRGHVDDRMAHASLADSFAKPSPDPNEVIVV